MFSTSKEIEVEIIDTSFDEMSNAARKFSDQGTKSENLAIYRNKIVYDLMYNASFKRQLVENCNFTLDCISNSTDCWNYIETETGVAYVRIWADNKITFTENDTVFRQMTQGAENAKLNDIRDKVTAQIIALDIVLDLMFTEILIKV